MQEGWGCETYFTGRETEKCAVREGEGALPLPGGTASLRLSIPITNEVPPQASSDL